MGISLMPLPGNPVLKPVESLVVYPIIVQGFRAIQTVVQDFCPSAVYRSRSFKLFLALQATGKSFSINCTCWREGTSDGSCFCIS